MLQCILLRVENPNGWKVLNFGRFEKKIKILISDKIFYKKPMCSKKIPCAAHAEPCAVEDSHMQSIHRYKKCNSIVYSLLMKFDYFLLNNCNKIILNN
jgi:hypothetical protein